MTIEFLVEALRANSKRPTALHICQDVRQGMDDTPPYHALWHTARRLYLMGLGQAEFMRLVDDTVSQWDLPNAPFSYVAYSDGEKIW